ncbi:MAG: hypothetical protein HRK26_01580 [Rickettsiaceae bacterium H1]|nr:hypothetical protein [Rickettsiaceae bacterium H1]
MKSTLEKVIDLAMKLHSKYECENYAIDINKLLSTVNNSTLRKKTEILDHLQKVKQNSRDREPTNQDFTNELLEIIDSSETKQDLEISGINLDLALFFVTSEYTYNLDEANYQRADKLISFGAKPDTLIDGQLTPLEEVIGRNYLNKNSTDKQYDFAKLLLEKGGAKANFPHLNHSILLTLISSGNIYCANRIIPLLLKHGTNPNQTSGLDKITPLHYCTIPKMTNIRIELIKHGARIDARLTDENNNKTPLEIPLLRYNHSRNEKEIPVIAEMLVYTGAYVDLKVAKESLQTVRTKIQHDGLNKLQEAIKTIKEESQKNHLFEGTKKAIRDNIDSVEKLGNLNLPKPLKNELTKSDNPISTAQSLKFNNACDSLLEETSISSSIEGASANPVINPMKRRTIN